MAFGQVSINDQLFGPNDIQILANNAIIPGILALDYGRSTERTDVMSVNNLGEKIGRIDGPVQYNASITLTLGALQAFQTAARNLRRGLLDYRVDFLITFFSATGDMFDRFTALMNAEGRSIATGSDVLQFQVPMYVENMDLNVPL